MLQLSNDHVIVVFIIILCKFTENESISDENYVHKYAAQANFSKLLTSIANVNEQRLNALKRYTALEKNILVSRIQRYSNDRENRHVLAIFLLNNNYPEDNLSYEIHNEDLSKSRDIPDHNNVQFSKEFNDDPFEVSREINKKELRNYIEVLNQDKMENTSERIESDKETRDGEEIIVHENANAEKGIKKNKETLKHPGEKLHNKDILRIWKSCSKKAVKTCVKACKKSAKDLCRSYRCSSSMKKSFKRKCKSNCKDRFSDSD